MAVNAPFPTLWFAEAKNPPVVAMESPEQVLVHDPTSAEEYSVLTRSITRAETNQRELPSLFGSLIMQLAWLYEQQGRPISDPKLAQVVTSEVPASKVAKTRMAVAVVFVDGQAHLAQRNRFKTLDVHALMLDGDRWVAALAPQSATPLRLETLEFPLGGATSSL